MFSLNVSASGINSVFCCFNYINCYCRSGNAVRLLLSWQQPVPVVGGASGFWWVRVLPEPGSGAARPPWAGRSAL